MLSRSRRKAERAPVPAGDPPSGEVRRLLFVATATAVVGALLFGYDASRAATGTAGGPTWLGPAIEGQSRDTIPGDPPMALPLPDDLPGGTPVEEASSVEDTTATRLNALLPLFLSPDTLAAMPLRPAMVLGDGIRVDTFGIGYTHVDTGRVARTLPPFGRDVPTASLRERRLPMGPPLGNYWSRETNLDSTDLRYVVRERVGGEDVRVPVTLGLDAYRDVRRQIAVDDGFRTIARQRAQRQQERSGVGFGFDIPGGAGAGLRTIFGSDQVDLRIHGQSNVDVGFAYRQNEQQEAATGQGGRIDPNFGQELGLSIIGTIGDKLEVNVNYDTQNDFDFQNQVRLTYTGYEDDIIQRVEAGNVFLPVESDLIRGGQRLFGIMADMRIGGLGITAVASQQDAESDELVIEGGSQTTPFQLIPTDYDDNAHFYLGYYFYNRWDVAHANPPNPIFGPVRSFENIEVYKFDISLTAPDVTDDIIAGVALLDLGEPVQVLEGGRSYLDFQGEDPSPPRPIQGDRYNQAALDALREGGFTSNSTARERLAANNVDPSVLREADLAVSRFRRLRVNQDYTVDDVFGTISLNQPLNESDVLAVAYTYRLADGTLVRVGDVGQGSGSGNIDDGPRVLLKLLRPSNMQPTDGAWDLTMRNIYRVGGRGLDPDGFEMQIEYAGSGQTAQRTLPGVSVGQQQTLLQTLGLDRVNQDGQPGSDDLFDFLPGFTIRPGSGRVIFPHREPFGRYLERLLSGQTDLDVRLDGFANAEEAIDHFVFDALYTEKPTTAQRHTDKNVYRLTGSSRGTVQDFYDLGFAIVEGSVDVRSGGTQLTAGVDYTVDYTTGSVTITNPAYLTPGRDISINFERQQFMAVQKKTLLGLRAQYDFSDRFAIGGTWMRLTERPMIDKYRVGEEPIANSIWGLDARYEADPMWITRMVDAIPLVQTRAPSRFEFRGEFAQLNPGHPTTIAFDRSRDQLQDLDGRDFHEDELGGISYIDDFEGTENTFSLMQPTAWRLSSGPTGDIANDVWGAGPDSVQTYLTDLPGGSSDIHRPGLRGNWRGLFGWYSVVPGAYDSGVLAGLPRTDASRPIPVREVFPERELPRGQPQVLTTLDLYFDPARRGPYNVNAELATTYSENPKDVWGGMTTRLPDGYRDFEARNNIEFVEFIFSPFGGRLADENIDPDASLYIDLGRVSGDVLPDGELNTEDGMLVPGPLGLFGRRGVGPTDGIINVNVSTQRTEDLGLNGLPSGDLCQAAIDNGTPYEICEAEFYAGFLSQLRATLPQNDPRLLRAEINPSGDEYRSFQDDFYFDNQSLWPGGAVLQERFSQFHSGYQGNSLEAQTQIAQRGTPGNSRQPDTEDLYLDGSLNTLEAFYRYEIPLNPQRLQSSPFYVETIENPDQESAPWYVVRIPVRTDEREEVGPIDGFRNVGAMRVWTQGHTTPATMRFAKLELVGSQWVKAEEINTEIPPPDIGDEEGPVRPQFPSNIFIASINTEEAPNRYRVPNGTVRAFTRDATSGDLIQNREQALVMIAERLGVHGQASIVKPFTSALDLTKYSNLRMFVHGRGFENARPGHPGDDVRVFLRIGANETDDYYEIEQPLYAWEPPDGMTIREYEEMLAGGGNIDGRIIGQASDSLWQTNVLVGDRLIDRNSINIAFDALNILKVERDLSRDPEDENAPWPLDIPYQKRVSDFAELAVGDFAPPGAVIRIRGTPSIQNVTSVAMGVRKRSHAGGPVDTEVWFNEMRVTGYDEESGWSAYARASLRMADFADLNVRYARQTDAFGDLASGLGDRSFRDEESFQVTANLNVHKFIPERFGWQIPVNVTVQNQVTTPRYSPRRGDITVEQEIEQIRQNEDLTQEERDRAVEEVRGAAQTTAFSRTFRIPISKRGSRSPWLQYTLDGLNFTYTNSLDERGTPQRSFDNNLRWSTALNYRLQVPQAKTVRPLWFMGEVPVLGLLGDLRMNILPQSVRLSADANRSINENQDRPSRELSRDPLRRALEDAAANDEGIARFLRPVNRRHTFGHTRAVEWQYNPFGFLSTGFTSRTRQSLDAAGIDPSDQLLVQRISDPDRLASFTDEDFDDLFWVELQDDGSFALGPGFGDVGISPGDEDEIMAFLDNPNSVLRQYPLTSIQVRPFTDVISDVLSGERQIRTEDYQQSFNASLQSPFERVEWLRWFQFTPVTFTSTFGWAQVPLTQYDVEDRPVVASLSTQASIRGGVRLRMRDLATKIGPWRSLEESQRSAEQNRRQREQRFEADLTAYREAVSRVEAATTALEAAEREADETGEEIPEEVLTEFEMAVAADTLSRPSPRLPIPNPLDLVRRTVLAVTGVRDININYDGSFGGSIGNVRNPGFSLFSSAMGSGPPLGFRLGFDRELPADAAFRFFGDTLSTFSFDDRFSDDHRLGARTSIEFSPQLRVDLTWDASMNSTETRSYSLDDNNVVVGFSESGRAQSSIVSFGGSYERLFELQMKRLREAGLTEDAPGDEPFQTDALSNNAVADDFRDAFVTSLGSFGPSGFFAIPIPNWNVQYSGIGDWPVIRALTQSATLRHGYSATFDASYRSFSSEPESRNLSVPTETGSETYVLHFDDAPRLRAEEPRINQRFQPLIGVDLNFRGGIQTNINWNTSSTHSLSTTNARLTNSETEELSLRFSFTRSGFRLPIPFVRGRLNNQLRLSVVMSRATNLQRAFNLRDDIIAQLGSERGAAPPETFLSPIPEVTVRTTVEPQISYTLSRAVTASFFVRYEHFESENSRIPTTTQINGGFNFRVSFSN